MKVYEYQAKALLAQYGVPVQPGLLAEDRSGIEAAVASLTGDLLVVKAQIHSGGRGKAGGVRLARSREEAVQKAAAMLGSRIVTAQNGPDGQIVHKVLIAEGLPVHKEYYLSLISDPENLRHLLIASPAGGMDIEAAAEASPDALVRQPVDPAIGIRDYQARDVALRIGIPAALTASFIAIVRQLHRLFVDKDCSLIEINPLVDTGDGRLFALDAKMDFDANALFRHPDIAALRDRAEEDPRESAASDFNLSYVALKGDIGCMVNGAGLAMATMDMIGACGGKPANFLDVGGGTTPEKVAGALKILLSDPQVRTILVNVFGGIVKCDVIASGIVAAAESVGVQVPLVVRLAGTRAEQGREILRQSGLGIITADTLAEAALKSIEAARAAGSASGASGSPPVLSQAAAKAAASAPGAEGTGERQ